MTNHPNRSKKLRTVTYKIVSGGGLARCQDGTASEIAIRVTGVPDNVRDTHVMIQLHKVVLLPPGGPWLVRWERLADAVQGSVLRDCK